MTLSYSIQALLSLARTFLYMCGKQVVCAVGQEERDVEKDAVVTGTEKQERLAVRLCLPSLQRRDDGSFNHSGYVWKMCKPSHFTYEFCAKLHIFRTSVAMRGQKITRKRMKIRIINEKASTPICFR